MQRILILSLLIVLGITNSITAQTTISGVVIDSLNNPVPFASVYLNNTTVGVYTDNGGVYSLTTPGEGVYEMVATCIGYKSSSRIINTNVPKQIVYIKLSVNPVILDEVVVEASRKRFLNYGLFKVLFLGNPISSKINNLKDLRLYGDESGNITRGYSVRPLVIENFALGYKIIYDLRDFTFNKATNCIQFSGTQYFQPMSGSNKRKKQWEENRASAYEGSKMHFFRSLYSDSADLTGFQISECRSRSIREDCDAGSPIDEKQLEIESDQNYKLLYHDKPISIEYTKSIAKKINKKIVITNVSEKSTLQFLDTVLIHYNGHFNNPYAITWAGKMGKERVSDMLPLDFMPAFHKKTDSISNIENKLLLPYINFFSTPREQIYTHFNKSGYLPGDEIWFTSYILDQTKGLPCNTSRILYIDFFDPAGKLQEQKILNVQNGTASNSLKLSKTNIAGRYTFRAYTNWMKNFQSSEEFNTYLEVNGKVEKDSLLINPLYDVQFLPESGTFLEGVLNRVGIKALDPNGKGVKLTGEIIDAKNQVIANIRLNPFGMGDLRITPGHNATYKAKVYLPDGREQLYDLPKTEERGLIIFINEQYKDKVAVQIVSNTQTVENGDAYYYFILHNEGEILKSATIFLTAQKPSVAFYINDSYIANGTNCITIFNKDFEPIAEKIFFKLKHPIRGK